MTVPPKAESVCGSQKLSLKEDGVVGGLQGEAKRV
jgi:hypothetical protein